MATKDSDRSFTKLGLVDLKSLHQQNLVGYYAKHVFKNF